MNSRLDIGHSSEMCRGSASSTVSHRRQLHRGRQGAVTSCRPARGRNHLPPEPLGEFLRAKLSARLPGWDRNDALDNLSTTVNHRSFLLPLAESVLETPR